MSSLASQAPIRNSCTTPEGGANLEWVFVAVETTTAILRAREKQEIAGILCWTHIGETKQRIIIKGEHGTLGYVPANMTGEIVAGMQAAGRGRLEGEILHVQKGHLLAHLRYVCPTSPATTPKAQAGREGVR